jgi:hypothetical protein
MKRLAIALLFVAGCGGVLVSARNVLDGIASSAVAQEAAVTQVCAAAVDQSWDDDQLQAVLDQCDRAYDLYEQLQADVEAVKAEVSKPSPDERLVAELLFKAERSAEAFAKAVAALLEGDA